MALFNVLNDMYHCFIMENMYKSTKFLRYAYIHKKKVLCRDIMIKFVRGIPPLYFARVEKGDAHISVHGTVKTDVLEENIACPYLVSSSVYEINPVHYLSLVCEELKW